MQRRLFPTLLTLAVILHVTSGTGDPFSIALCSEGGVKCDNTCRKLGSCLNVGGEFQWEEALACETKYCNINTLSCTSELQDCVPNADKIGCGTAGTFPDPYDCRSRYECKEDLEPSKTVDYCTGSHGYDACTYQCDRVLSNGKCTDVGPLCQNPTQVSMVVGNRRMFYQCVADSDGILYPVLHMCPDGFFDEAQRKCVPSTDPGC